MGDSPASGAGTGRATPPGLGAWPCSRTGVRRRPSTRAVPTVPSRRPGRGTVAGRVGGYAAPRGRPRGLGRRRRRGPTGRSLIATSSTRGGRAGQGDGGRPPRRLANKTPGRASAGGRGGAVVFTRSGASRPPGRGRRRRRGRTSGGPSDRQATGLTGAARDGGHRRATVDRRPARDGGHDVA